MHTPLLAYSWRKLVSNSTSAFPSAADKSLRYDLYNTGWIWGSATVTVYAITTFISVVKNLKSFLPSFVRAIHEQQI
jgi:hypothetical protein